MKLPIQKVLLSMSVNSCTSSEPHRIVSTDSDLDQEDEDLFSRFAKPDISGSNLASVLRGQIIEGPEQLSSSVLTEVVNAVGTQVIQAVTQQQSIGPAPLTGRVGACSIWCKTMCIVTVAVVVLSYAVHLSRNTINDV